MSPDAAAAADGRGEADRIALESLAEAAVAAGRGALPPGLSDAFAHLSGHHAPSARSLGLAAMRLLRHAALSACLEHAGRDVPADALLALDRVDAVVTALGGVPVLFDDPDDWGLPEGPPGEPCPPGLAGEAGVLASAALGVRAALRDAGREAALMRRDASCLAGLCLVIDAAFGGREGPPRDLVAQVAAESLLVAGRIEAAVHAWAAHPSPPLADAALARLDRSVREAGSILAAMADTAAGPTPGV